MWRNIKYGAEDENSVISTYLPSCRAVAVPLILEVGNVLHHPVVHLTEGQPLLRAGEDGLGDQVGVAQVTPGVPPRGTLLRDTTSTSISGERVRVLKYTEL